jgi:hypothetical protein
LNTGSVKIVPKSSLISLKILLATVVSYSIVYYRKKLVR